MELVLTPAVKKQLAAIKRRPGGSYLFYGAEALGKFTAANKLAAAITKHAADVLIVESGKSIGIDAIHQLRQALHLKGRDATGQRVVIIRDAHLMTREAQNALLKILEEPPADTTMILTVHQTDMLAPTVISRCRKVEFASPDSSAIASLAASVTSQPADAKRLVLLAQGRPGLIVRLADDAEYRQQQIAQYQLARSLMEDELYEGLKKLNQADPADAKAMLLRLADTLRLRLRRQPESAGRVAGQLKMIEQLLDYIAANGNPKFALDKAILEVS